MMHLKDIAINAAIDAPLTASDVLGFLCRNEVRAIDPTYALVSRRDYLALKEDMMHPDLMTGFVLLTITNPHTGTRVRITAARDQEEGVVSFVKLYHSMPVEEKSGIQENPRISE